MSKINKLSKILEDEAMTLKEIASYMKLKEKKILKYLGKIKDLCSEERGEYLYYYIEENTD